jgi:hypothetical protein
MRGMKTGYFSGFDTSPVTGGKDEVAMGLYVVKVSLIFDFATRGVGDGNRKGVGLGIYESSLIIDDICGPEIGEPIIRIFFAVCVDELWIDARD